MSAIVIRLYLLVYSLDFAHKAGLSGFFYIDSPGHECRDKESADCGLSDVILGALKSASDSPGIDMPSDSEAVPSRN